MLTGSDSVKCTALNRSMTELEKTCVCLSPTPESRHKCVFTNCPCMWLTLNRSVWHGLTVCVFSRAVLNQTNSVNAAFVFHSCGITYTLNKLGTPLDLKMFSSGRHYSLQALNNSHRVSAS